VNSSTEPMTAALMAIHRVNSDLLWALEWIDSLTDDLNTGRETEHPRTREFLEDLAQRRTESDPLDVLAREVQL
jgi:hypothetical protein